MNALGNLQRHSWHGCVTWACRKFLALTARQAWRSTLPSGSGEPHDPECSLRLRGDKSGEMSISNALTALTKNGTFLRNAEKRYCPGPNIGLATQGQLQPADA